MFAGGGLFDTKYVAEYVEREKASFLGYLYKKAERTQRKRRVKGLDIGKGVWVEVECAEGIAVDEEMDLVVGANGQEEGKKRKRHDESERKGYCVRYASHGHCPLGKTCAYSHDLDVILDAEAAEVEAKAQKRKAKKQHLNPENGLEVDADTETTGLKSATEQLTTIQLVESVSATQPAAQPPSSNSNSNLTTTSFKDLHSSHFDAYMTAYIFAHQVCVHQGLKKAERDKLYLMGKQVPLLVRKSGFVKCSEAHQLISQKREK
ncbi:Target of EGR1, member 1 (Nuclear) [Chytridiales sp. JEL 0842]|nr:Target of EGR1, member 1 (Nuclear) [Chytridiales sp. JEL 0842]